MRCSRSALIRGLSASSIVTLLFKFIFYPSSLVTWNSLEEEAREFFSPRYPLRPSKSLPMAGRNSLMRKHPHLCQGISSLSMKQELHNGRNHNPVLHLGDTWCGPGGILCRFFLRIGTHCAAQDNLAALHFNRHMLSIRLCVADKRLLDVLLQVCRQWMRPDR